MSVLPSTIAGRPLPQLRPVTQHFERPQLADVSATAYAEVARGLQELGARPGERVAIGAGSRGIRDLVPVLRATVAACRASGLFPYLVPAMGSHGGGTAEGQRHVLEHLGVNETSVGAPVVSNNEVVQIGETDWGMPIYFDREALQADWILPVNRVKPHTDFTGPQESGLCKMLVIGFANHAGCARVHQETFARFHTVVPTTAAAILEKVPVGFGLAIVENAYDESFIVEAIPRRQILAREAELLQIAYAHMARLHFEHIDVLIVDMIGKEISGAGMDPNIIGRTAKGILPGYRGPTIARIVVGGLTPTGGGNAIGIGQADFTTESGLGQIDRVSTYVNAIAAGTPESGRLPIALPTLDDAVRAALLTSGIDDWNRAAVVRIANTLQLDKIAVSHALAETVDRCPNLSWR